MALPSFSPEQIDRIISMAWEDRTPFEAIYQQFGLNEKSLVLLMKKEMHLKNWKKWRARVKGRKTKFLALRPATVTRFKASRQRAISGNRIAKR
jgi:uncharacterized protein (TIGR03643 family)